MVMKQKSLSTTEEFGHIADTEECHLKTQLLYSDRGSFWVNNIIY